MDMKTPLPKQLVSSMLRLDTPLPSEEVEFASSMLDEIRYIPVEEVGAAHARGTVARRKLRMMFIFA